MYRFLLVFFVIGMPWEVAEAARVAVKRHDEEEKSIAEAARVKRRTSTAESNDAEEGKIITGLGQVRNLTKVLQSTPLNWDVWGDGCYGYWTPWSECSNQCTQTRTWNEVQRSGKCLGMPIDKRVDIRNCNWGKCSLKNREYIPLASVELSKVILFIHKIAFPFSAFMLLILMVTTKVRQLNLESVPDGLVIMAVSAVIGFLARTVWNHGVTHDTWSDEIFNSFVSAVLLYLVLPVSIFEGAYHCQRLNFWSEMVSGLILAIFGVLLSAIVIAGMVKYTADLGLHPVNTWREAFCYAAFIADTDPVATLAVFAKLKADALLTTLVAGEATLNDPVAIVIFGITNSPGDLEFTLPLEILGAIKLLVCSILMGLALGLFLTLLFNVSSLHGNEDMERSYVIFSAFFCFHMGEFVGMSGIIVCLFGGLMMGIYLAPNLKEPEKVDSTLADIARLMDSITFVIVGFGVIRMNDYFNDGIKLGLLTLLFCIVSRIVVCGVLILVCNLIKYIRGFALVPANTSIMIMHSGLRGAMTLMMALNIDPAWSQNKGVLIDATMITVMGLMVIIGTTGPFMLRLTGVPMNVPQEDGSLFHDGTNAARSLSKVHELIEGFLVLTKDSNSPRHLTGIPRWSSTSSMQGIQLESPGGARRQE